MEKLTDTYQTLMRDHAARPEGQKARWTRHYKRTISVKDEKHVFKRFFANLKVFLLDTWFDILCILITCGIAGAVCRSRRSAAALTIRYG